MRVCLTCNAWGEELLCGECRERLTRLAAVRQGNLTVFSGYRHESTARRLVHLLKYHGIVAAAVPLAVAMAECLPADVSALIPVPRAWMRKARFGIDPASELARRIARLMGLPVIAPLRSRLWWPAHAGSNRSSRMAPGFRLVGPIPAGAVLVDDVLTTGVTLLTAGELTRVYRAVTATRACGNGFDRIGAGVG